MTPTPRPGTAPSRLDSRADCRTEGSQDDGPAVVGRAAMSARQLKAMFLESGPGAVAVPGSAVDAGGAAGTSTSLHGDGVLRGSSLEDHSDAEHAEQSTTEETRLLRRHQSEQARPARGDGEAARAARAGPGALSRHLHQS